MKTRFLCLLGLVTVMISYAPLARAEGALHFDKSSANALPSAIEGSTTEGSIWMATDPILKKENPDATNEGTEALPGARSSRYPQGVAPTSKNSELSVKPSDKLGATVNKEVPTQPILSFAEPPTSVKAPVAQSESIEAAPVQAVPVHAPVEPIQTAPVQPVASRPVPAPSPQSSARKPIELVFSLPSTEPLYETEPGIPSVVTAPPIDSHSEAAGITDKLFTGNTDSLVAKAVGSAEGTRTPEGDRTHAYYGHADPGNRVWNRGSFSYQHAAQSPEDADQKQLSRLAEQAKVIEAKAADYGLQLTLEEKLNGIDLANQAPKAALDKGGYVDWLAQARQNGMSGSDAVLWARTRAFINPATQRWDAPGLGNTAEAIGHDQSRRMDAIARAIAANQDAVSQAVKVASSSAKATVASASSPAKTAEKSVQQAPSVQAGQGIAQLLAEKIVELFGGNHVPADSSPVGNEPAGVQQLFGFAF